MATQKAQKQNVGNAGEYYIAARLSALNFTATITLGRAEKYDILALSPNGRLIKISVKATQVESATDFSLSAKDEEGATEDFYYAFVKLNGFVKEPDFWISKFKSRFVTWPSESRSAQPCKHPQFLLCNGH